MDQAGGLSPYGTMAQGGNVTEWMETEADGVNNSPSAVRIERGGGWRNDSSRLLATGVFSDLPSDGFDDIGFRVASVPEPGTLSWRCWGWA